MRQGGMKPKGHNSGVYWVRANAKQGGGKTKKKLGEDDKELSPNFIDLDGDGEVSFLEWLHFFVIIGGVAALFGLLIWLNYT